MVQLEKMNQKERKEKPKSTFSKEMRELIDSLVQEENTMPENTRTIIIRSQIRAGETCRLA